jgi:hypothetical protein
MNEMQVLTEAEVGRKTRAFSKLPERDEGLQRRV